MINPEELAYRAPQKKKFRLPTLKKPPTPSKKSLLISGIFMFGILLGAGAIFGYQYYLNRPAPVVEDKPEVVPQEVLGLIEKVETKVPDIPKNEFPSVATVKDLATLSDQEFFQGAQVGDKILIYSVSKRAFLYRPSTDTLVRNAPVEIIGEAEETEASSSAVLSASDSAQPALRIQY
jgi:hypothetical protein